MQQNGLALEHAPNDFRNNTKVVHLALKQNPQAVKFLGEELLSDPRFMKKIRKKYPDIKPYLRTMDY